MIDLTVEQIAQAISGEIFGRAEVLVTGSVETDSRLVKPGALFVAKPGEETDGHLFAKAAQDAGAVALIVQHQVADSTLPQIVVADSVTALGQLATFVLAQIRATSDLKVIGVTGSNGKTTTKNMLKAILSTVGETNAPIESYNNEVGAPYSILQTTEATRYLVVEMGAGGSGSIDYLAQIAKPDIAIVLKVGLAHVGEFGGIETTARIKGELPKALSADAKLILNSDDSYVAAMAAETKAQVHWFGTGTGANYRISETAFDITGTNFELHWPDGTNSKVGLQILGEHNAMNATAAAAAADLLGVDRKKIVAALEALPLAERWRMQVTNLPSGITVINDAYNASPDSMRAALQALATLGKSGRRTIAVLGEMAELGDAARTEHDAIGRLAVRLNISQVFAVGAGAKLIHMGAEQEGSWAGESKFFASIDEALEHLRGMLTSGDLVLVKSSKSANLRHLGDALTKEIS